MLQDLCLVLWLFFCLHLGITQSGSWVISRMVWNRKFDSPFWHCDIFSLLDNNYCEVPPPPITVETLSAIFVNSFLRFINDRYIFWTWTIVMIFYRNEISISRFAPIYYHFGCPLYFNLLATTDKHQLRSVTLKGSYMNLTSYVYISGLGFTLKPDLCERAVVYLLYLPAKIHAHYQRDCYQVICETRAPSAKNFVGIVLHDIIFMVLVSLLTSFDFWRCYLWPISINPPPPPPKH